MSVSRHRQAGSAGRQTDMGPICSVTPADPSNVPKLNTRPGLLRAAIHTKDKRDGKTSGAPHGLFKLNQIELKAFIVIALSEQ